MKPYSSIELRLRTRPSSAASRRPAFSRLRDLRTVEIVLFIETSTFTRQLPRYLDDDGYAALQAFLGVHPEAGDVIRGTGGVRKIRWTMAGRRKRGGSRIIYYWLAKEEHIYLLTVYAKGAKDDLTAAERAAWRKAVEAIDND